MGPIALGDSFGQVQTTPQPVLLQRLRVLWAQHFGL